MTTAARTACGPSVASCYGRGPRACIPPPAACTWGVRLRRTSQLLVLPEASVLQAEPAPRGEAGHQGCAESDRSPQRPRPPHAARKKPALPAFSPLETNPDSGSLQTLRGRCGGRDSRIARKSWSPPLSPAPLNFRINALKPHLLAKQCRLAGWLHSQGRKCPVHPLILAVQRGPEEAPWDRAVCSHCTWSPSCWVNRPLRGPSAAPQWMPRPLGPPGSEQSCVC